MANTGNPRRPQATVKRRRRVSAAALNAIGGTVKRQHDALDPASPRVRPTLSVLKFLQRDPDAVGGATEAPPRSTQRPTSCSSPKKRSKPHSHERDYSHVKA
jgi:hypothetical protein